jgi:ribosomal protein S18 acetylase RimI-like enzyme
MLIAEIIFFRGWRYFVELEGHIVGVLAVHEEAEALFVCSLAVSPERRRLGIAACVLIHAEKLARKLSKKRLELSVLRGNIPAQKLYERFGFVRKQQKRWSFVLSRGVEKQASID